MTCALFRTSMKLAVIGATGPTGALVVSQALEKGHEVVALVRNPEKLKLSNTNLKVNQRLRFESILSVEGKCLYKTCTGGQFLSNS